MTDNNQAGATVPPAAGWPARGRPWVSAVALLVVLLLALSALAVVALESGPAASPGAALAPAEELDGRWGTYLSEREWGTPREALGTDGWGLSWRGAIDTDYRYSEDGIAGVTDDADVFRVGWAFWDGREPHVTERFNGATGAQSDNGATIIDDRVFHENTPTHAYSRLVYRYPPEDPAFEIELESAKVDSSTIVMQATATNADGRERDLDIVLKAWMAPQSEVEPIDGGFYLRGAESALIVVGEPATTWQVSDVKEALDVNLRAGGLNGDDSGHIGALAYRRSMAPDESVTLRFALAEVPLPEENAGGAAATAVDGARNVLAGAANVLATRRAEARQLFIDDVTQHGELYQQALMTLLWNKSYYRWDGTSGVNLDWAGRVDVRDVLIMPDKWEYPWLSSWQSAFHAVSATLIEPELAADQLRFVLSDRWQQPDGHIPCGEWLMDGECPPVFAWAAWRIFQESRDRDFLAEVYPALQRHYDYWWQNHRVGDALFTGGFMGMENMPRARGHAQADASAWMAFFARDMVRIASELGDVGASERYWIDRGLIQEQINAELWDEETGFYYDLTDDGFVRQKSYSGLIPLIAGVVPPQRMPAILAALRDEEQFLGPGGIRSLSAASPLYEPGVAGNGVNSNWRGPVWLPINYLIVHTLADIDRPLADDLRDRLVETVENDWQRTGRLHEFFDGDTGEGLGADAHGGTTLVANLIAEGWPAR